MMVFGLPQEMIPIFDVTVKSPVLRTSNEAIIFECRILSNELNLDDIRMKCLNFLPKVVNDYIFD